VGDLIPFRDDVQGRPKPEPCLQIHQVSTSILASRGIHVVGKHQREALSTGPSLKTIRRFSGSFIDRPSVAIAIALPSSQRTP
jgi:hypothetical protein